jgi:signal transduction histidine kinase
MPVGSLRVRFLAAVGTLVVTVLAAVGFLSGRIATEQIHRYLGEEDGRRADSVATLLRPPFEKFFLNHDTWSGVEGIVTELAPTAADSAILVLDSKLGFVASSEPRLTGITARRRSDGGLRLSGDMGAGRGRTAGTIELVVRNGMVTISDSDGSSAGTLVVLPGLGGRGGALERLAPSIRGKLMAIVAIAGFFALACTWWLTGRMLDPVSELTQATREIAAGHLDRRVETYSGDEIGRLSAAFNAMAEKIERGEFLRRTMVSDVAHELRTPLTGIRCQLEALQDGLISPEPEVFDSLHDDILSLQRLVDDLQELAVAEAGGVVLELQPVDLLKEIEVVQRSMVNGTGRSIEVDVGQLPPILADPERLRQILRNLFDNACQHSGAEARVRVAASVANKAVETVVEDNGPGIPQEHLDLVFERFYRVESSRQRETGGAGLGLAITRQLVLAHGGHIRAESTAGCGARFVFTLPISS